jgi:NAD+ synthase (glutamine-hydrolysing)
MNFVKVAAACPITNVGDVDFNLENTKKCINDAIEKQSKIVVFPELSITSYTCSDLFLQKRLLEKCEIALESLCNFSEDKDILIAVGGPFEHNYQLFNVAYIIFKGKLLGIVPKSYLPNYSEFYEKRWFSSGLHVKSQLVDLSFQENIPFGTNLIFTSGEFKVGFEICEDL